MSYLYELPRSIRYAIERLSIVPVGPDEKPAYVFAFEVHDLEDPKTGAAVFPGLSRAVAVSAGADLANPRTLLQTDWDTSTRLHSAIPVQPDGRCVLLGSDWRLDPRRRRFVERHWLMDVLSEESREQPVEFLRALWPGKQKGFYTPLVAGGRVRNGGDFVVLARLVAAPRLDHEEVSLVALRIDAASLAVQAELVLHTQPFPFGVSPPSYRPAITPIADGSADGWVVILESGGRIVGFNIESGVNRFWGPVEIYDGTGATPRGRPAIAGSSYFYPGSGDRGQTRTGSYMVAYQATRRTGASESPYPSAAVEAFGITFDWATGHAEGQPIRELRETWYGRSHLDLSLAADTNTKSHWLLLDSGSVGPKSGPEFDPSTSTVRRELRFSYIGYTGTAYAQYRPAGPDRMPPQGIGFDHRSDRGVIAGQAWEADRHGLWGQTVGLHSPIVSAISWEGDRCARIAPTRSTPRALRTSHPYAGHRFFEVELIEGPAEELVQLWVGPAFLVRTAEPCDWAIDLDDPDSVRIGPPAGIRTNAAGYASTRVPISEDALPGIFDPSAESLRLRGAIDDYQRVLIAQWRWPAQFSIEDIGTVFTWEGLPGRGAPVRDARIRFAHANSNPVVLFLGA